MLLLVRVDMEDCHMHSCELLRMTATPDGPMPIVKRLIQIGIRYAGGGKRLGAALPCLVASTYSNIYIYSNIYT